MSGVICKQILDGTEEVFLQNKLSKGQLTIFIQYFSRNDPVNNKIQELQKIELEREHEGYPMSLQSHRITEPWNGLSWKGP